MLPRLHTTTRTLLLTVSACLALGLGGCNGAFVGNFVVLGITLGVFFGTLGLGRTRPVPRTPTQPSAERSQSDV